jgi:hypothetical protein
MIALSLFASLVLTTAALGILATLMRDNSALKAVFVESE